MPISGRNFDPGHGELPILLSERRVRLNREPSCLIRTNRTGALAMRQPAQVPRHAGATKTQSCALRQPAHSDSCHRLWQIRSADLFFRSAGRAGGPRLVLGHRMRAADLKNRSALRVSAIHVSSHARRYNSQQRYFHSFTTMSAPPAFKNPPWTQLLRPQLLRGSAPREKPMVSRSLSVATRFYLTPSGVGV